LDKSLHSILYVDDEEDIREVVALSLQLDSGLDVAIAASGADALRYLETRIPDLVVLDLSMPGLNGIEAARLIHEQFPEMDMIILSMHEPYEVMDQLAGSGVRACVLKTDLEDLVVAIRGIQKLRTSSTTVVVPSKSRNGDKAHVR